MQLPPWPGKVVPLQETELARAPDGLMTDTGKGRVILRFCREKG